VTTRRRYNFDLLAESCLDRFMDSLFSARHGRLESLSGSDVK
jgi:hypothetical protein